MSKTMHNVISAAALFAAATIPGGLEAQSEVVADVARANTIEVNVDNGHWLDVRIYAVLANGAYGRIGTVTSFSTQQLEIPRWLSAQHSEIQLVAVPIGSSQQYVAPSVVVSQGDVIDLRLRNNLALSSILIRAG